MATKKKGTTHKVGEKYYLGFGSREKAKEAAKRWEKKEEPKEERKKSTRKKTTKKETKKVKKPIRLETKEEPKKQGMFPSVSAQMPKEETIKETKEEPIRLGEPPEESRWDRLTTGEKVRLGVGGAALLGAAVMGGAAIATAGATAATVGSTTVQTTLSGGVIKAAPFVTNAKTIGLTKSLLTKLGMTTAVAAMVGTVVGTYPFAHFELAEASDKIGIAMFRAAQEGDEERVIELNNYLEEMLDMNVWEKVLSIIPFANVYQSVSKNIAAARESANHYKEMAQEEIQKKTSGEETEFQRERRESDEMARERELAEREEDTAHFEEQAKKKKEEDLEEMRWKAEYYALIREGKFEEADELLSQQGG